MSTQAWKRLAAQYRAALKDPIEDVAVLDNTSGSLQEIEAVIFGPAGTPYEGGAFRMKLVYDDGYPSQPPKGTFVTKIFHPNVGPRGEICVNTLKRDWDASVTVGHILQVVKCLLIEPGPDSALNEDAGKLLMEDYEAFAAHARMYTKVHALTQEQGLALIGEDRRSEQKLSYRPSTGTGSRTGGAAPEGGGGVAGVLAQSSKTNSKTSTSDGTGQPVQKKAKVLDPEAAAKRKAAEARKKSLKRL